MPEVRGFIFDLDGVITDTAELHYQSWKQLADEEGIPFTREDNEQLRGVSRRESLERLLKGRPLPEPTKESWMARKNAYYRDSLASLSPSDLLPGVREFLEAARGMGLKIGLGSASKNARDVLEALQITALFDAVGDGYSVVNPKPAPDLFVWVAGHMGIYPQQVVVFEDAEAGIDAAKAGGFLTVGVGTAGVDHADWHIVGGLNDTSPRAVIDRFRTIDE